MSETVSFQLMKPLLGSIDLLLFQTIYCILHGSTPTFQLLDPFGHCEQVSNDWFLISVHVNVVEYDHTSESHGP